METSLQAKIQVILPNIGNTKAALVANRLCKEAGVEGDDDLQYIMEEDLDMLKPVQKRKLLQAWRSDNVSPKVVEQSLQAPSSSSASTSSSRPKDSNGSSAPIDGNGSSAGVGNASTTAPDWFRKYVVPWNAMSKALLQQLKGGKRPLPSQRREMVRIIIKDVRTICPVPKKAQLSHIAAGIVAKYPKSFEDILCGRVVGSGSDSLLKNLTEKAGNANRGNASARNHCNAAAEPGKKRRTTTTDSYGCVDYCPDDLPLEESEETQERKKQELKEFAFQKEQGQALTQEKVKSNMKDTYVTQRRDIVEKQLPVSELVSEWPFLFTLRGMCLHAELLVGINMKLEIQKSLEQKGKLILQYFRAKNAKKTVQAVLTDIDTAKGALGNNKPEMPGVILLLLAHFGEDVDSIFTVMETTATKSDVQNTEESKPPTLIACGDILTAERYMLNIDGNVVHCNLQKFPDALTMMFASYYVFGIEYHSDSSATMEFVQRCMVGINPDRGCKGKKKCRYTMNPKLLSLVNGIQNFQTGIFLGEHSEEDG